MADRTVAHWAEQRAARWEEPTAAMWEHRWAARTADPRVASMGLPLVVPKAEHWVGSRAAHLAEPKVACLEQQMVEHLEQHWAERRVGLTAVLWALKMVAQKAAQTADSRAVYLVVSMALRMAAPTADW